MESSERKKFTTLDLSLAAYLQANEIEFTLEDRKGRKVFVADADDKLYRLLNDFNSNGFIGVIDFVTAQKILKQRLYAAKGMK